MSLDSGDLLIMVGLVLTVGALGFISPAAAVAYLGLVVSAVGVILSWKVKR